MNSVRESLDKVAARETQLALPAVTNSDNGKLLTVVSGEWAKAADRLPAVSASDNGKILLVSGGAWTKAAFVPLPTVTSSDEGKILKVNSSGQWVAASAT